MPSESQRKPLPFEPKSSKQSVPKAAASNSASSKAPSPSSKKASSNTPTPPNSSDETTSIPEVVSRRMIRRMAIFAGVPTFLGMSSFVVAYILLTRHIVEFPNVVVLLVSLGFFGLGTLGLSYGVLSASWQEDIEGSWLGTAEFSVNFRRLVQGLRKRPSASDQ
ncbi:MAG: PAM68 family protein [Cyanobacteria bacterium P01_F01_bin.13]